MSSDHDEIRRWAEERGASPARVTGTVKERLRGDESAGGPRDVAASGWSRVMRESDPDDTPPLPPDQTPGAPVKEPPDKPTSVPDAPVREPGPAPAKKYGSQSTRMESWFTAEGWRAPLLP